MVTWSDGPQPELPPATEREQNPVPVVQRLGELLPAVLALHGLSEDTSAETSPTQPTFPHVGAPLVVPQPECPAG